MIANLRLQLKGQGSGWPVGRNQSANPGLATKRQVAGLKSLAISHLQLNNTILSSFFWRDIAIMGSHTGFVGELQSPWGPQFLSVDAQKPLLAEISSHKLPETG